MVNKSNNKNNNEISNKVEETAKKISIEIKDGYDKAKNEYNSFKPETKKRLWTGLGIVAGFLALRSTFKKKNKD